MYQDNNSSFARILDKETGKWDPCKILERSEQSVKILIYKSPSSSDTIKEVSICEIEIIDVDRP